MSKDNKAPFNNLEEIAARKRQLRKAIKRQENDLSNDIEAYREEIDSLKGVWHGMASIRRFRKNGLKTGLSQSADKSSRWVTAFTIGFKAVKWLVNRRKKK